MKFKPEEAEKFKEIRRKLSEREILDFLLVITSCRPACLIMDPEDEELELIENLCDKIGFETRTFQDEDSSLLGTQGLFVYRDEDRIELLEGSDGRFYGLDDRDVGDFLGFPKEDTEYFHNQIRDGPVEPETREKVESMKREGLISSKEAEIVEIVSYVPKPSEDGVLKAVERSKSYLENIEGFDDQNGSELGKYVVESFLGVTVDSLQNLT